MKVQLEHANLHVNNVDAVLGFLSAAFPSFYIRHDSGRDDNERWVHFGDEHTYLAIYQATKPAGEAWQPYSGRPGLNHLGFVVEDVQALRQRLLDAGYKETTIANDHPARKRIYFNDPEGNDWEFLQYLTDDPEQRNDYEIG